MHKVGVIHGRFQILHHDHVKYLMAGKERCEHLVVGITNPDPMLTASDCADEERSLSSANPLTYYERYQMVKTILLEQGLAADAYSIVPFPINFPELYKYYVPTSAVFFLTIYDQWGERKRQLFESLGLQVEVLWKKSIKQKGISSSFIRRLMQEGKNWEQYVPGAIAAQLININLPDRLRR